MGAADPALPIRHRDAIAAPPRRISPVRAPPLPLAQCMLIHNLMNRTWLRSFSLCALTLLCCDPKGGPPQDGGPPPDAGPVDGSTAADMGPGADMNRGEYDPECEEYRATADPAPGGLPRPGLPLDRLVISPEVATDAPVPGLAFGDQIAPAVATNGSGYLLVWADRRAEHQMDSTHTDLVAARLDRDGKLLDPSGIPLRVAPGTSQSGTALASDGTNYLAVWLQRRPGGDRTYYDVRAARVAADGRVLDPTPITLDEGDAERYQPAVDFDGLNYLVTWYTYRPFGPGPQQAVLAKRVSPDGKVLEADPIQVASGSNLWQDVDVTYAAGRHLIVWTQGKDAYGTRVCRSGKVLDPSGIQISNTGKYTRAASVTTNGSEFLAVWGIQLGDVTGPNVQAARVLPDGTVRDRPGINLARGFLARAAWNGTEYVIPLYKEINSTRFDLQVMRVSATGALVDPAGSKIAAGPDSVTDPPLHDVACGAAGCVLTWPQRGAVPDTTFDVRATRLSAAGAALDTGGLAVSTAANRQISPAVAGSGSGYLLIWQDGRAGAPLLGTRLSAAGAVMDPTALSISANHTRYKIQPALAYLGGATPSYLAVWTDNRDNAYGDIYAARVTPAGVVQEPSGIRVAGSSIDESTPAVACGGGQCLVVWQQQGGGYYDIYGARVSAAGVVLDPGRIKISDAALSQVRPRVAWSGSHFLVVWGDLRNGGVYSTYGARVSAAGVVLDPTGIVISGVGNEGLSPEVSCDGTNCLVAYLSGATDILGRRVSGTGALLGAAATLLARSTLLRTPALAFDGTNHVLLWADGRSGSAYDLYEARFSPAGAALDGMGYPVAGHEFDEVETRLSAGSGGQHLIAYRRLDMTQPLGAARVRTRLVTP